GGLRVEGAVGAAADRVGERLAVSDGDHLDVVPLRRRLADAVRPRVDHDGVLRADAGRDRLPIGARRAPERDERQGHHENTTTTHTASSPPLVAGRGARSQASPAYQPAKRLRAICETWISSVPA